MTYFVWNFERGQYWRSGHHGYTPKKSEAGRYDIDQALAIVNGGNIAGGDAPEEAMIPADDVNGND